MQIKTLAAGLVAGCVMLGVMSGTAAAFNPQPDPPGFGIVSINPGQTIRLNVVCWQHPVDGVPPGPCSGELIFRDMAGNDVARQAIKLIPGQAASLDFTPLRSTDSAVLVGIDPQNSLPLMRHLRGPSAGAG